MADRPTFQSFRDKALALPEVKAEYEALSAAFEMKRGMIAMRKAAGMTQEQMAALLGTKKSNISRLESLNTNISPRLATVEDYARVLGYSVRVEFEPRTQ
jgi:DNA-binding XRE family transcriptional regulator